MEPSSWYDDMKISERVRKAEGEPVDREFQSTRNGEVGKGEESEKEEREDKQNK